MKYLYRIITAIFLLISLLLSASGCSLVDKFISHDSSDTSTGDTENDNNNNKDRCFNRCKG